MKGLRSKDDLCTCIDKQTRDQAIFTENCSELYIVSQIVLRGKYNCEYKVVSHSIKLNAERVLVDGDFLLICLFSELAIINLAQNRMQKIICFDCYELFGIYKFQLGYFLHGEGENRFINESFELVWEESAVDIFVNYKAEKDIEISDDLIAVYDWAGFQHFYDEHGEFCRIYNSRYNCNEEKDIAPD